MKMVVVVIASHCQPCYPAMLEVWKLNWIRQDLDIAQYKLLFVSSSTEDRLSISSNGIMHAYAKQDETFIPGILQKTIYAFQLLDQMRFRPEYVFRTNLSSHVDIKKLETFMSTSMRRSDKTVMGCSPHRDHLSGAGMAISWDLVCKMVTEKDQLDWSLIDDVSISIYLAKLTDIHVIWGNRVDLVEGSEPYKLGDGVPYHVRCKHNDRLKDVALLARLAADGLKFE